MSDPLNSALNASDLIVTLVVTSIRSIIPLSWLYVGLTCYQSDKGMLRSPAHAFGSKTHAILLIYTSIEVLFSIYQAACVRYVQRRGPAPAYGRRFLRQVFSRALENGMDEEVESVGNGNGVSYAKASGITTDLRNGNGTIGATRAERRGSRPAPSPLATGRLRAASFVPRFVDKEPLHRDDPRARIFAEQQAMWFPGSRPEDLTRRDIEQWLAWSLYGAELTEIEAERQAALANKGPQLPQRGARTRLQALQMQTMSPPASPVPEPQSVFMTRQSGDEEDQARSDSSDEDTVDDSHTAATDTDDEDYFSEDKRGARAQPGEWDSDPVRGDRLEFLHYCRDLIEARQGFAFPDVPIEQWTPRPSMRLTIDKVVVTARPLLIYLVVNAVTQLAILTARYRGFKLERQGRLKYLIHRPKGWSPRLAKRDQKYQPIVFLHGLGIGLGQYATLVHDLLSSRLSQTHPILIPLQPHISQAIFDPRNHLRPMLHYEFTAQLRRVFRREHWLNCGITVMSHSNGTMVHSWLLKSAGDVVRRSCFVDPVCFQLWVPHIVGQFLYRKPATAVMRLMSFFVARELGTANMLSRYFDWSSCLLWPDDEIPHIDDPRRCQVYLASEDSILNAAETRRYLRRHGLREVSDMRSRHSADELEKDPLKYANLHVIDGAKHGEVLMGGGKHISHIIDWLDGK